jgi:hypothetical protein
VRGLAIRGFDEQGILVESAGNFIEGNFIGTDSSGTVPFPNSMAGVFIASSNNTVGGTVAAARNLLSANTDGVNITTGASSNTVQGNFIGTAASGLSGLGNAVWGVFVGGPDNTIGGVVPGAGNLVGANILGGIGVNGAQASGNLIAGNFVGVNANGTTALPNDSAGIIFTNGASLNTVGGTAPSARNVVSGNAEFGIAFGTGATLNVVEGNYVGTDFSGAVGLGNGLSGLVIQDAPGNTIGGSTPGAGNVISGNGGHGVFLFDANGPTNDNEILGNRIGTNAAGTSAIANGLDGVRVSGAVDTTIGGTAPGAGNLISGNTFNGLRIDEGASGVEVLGNRIGLDATGSAALPNVANGVIIVGASDNTVGGIPADAANVISGNSRSGVTVTGASQRNAILGNSIGPNGFMGIDLNGFDGVTPNDPGDSDSGPNDLQNFPVLASATATPVSLTVSGSLSSQASTTYRVEFFASEACDSTGHGEGRRFLGFTAVTTGGGGAAGFNEVLPGVAEGDQVTATASDPAGNTSEFSACVSVVCSAVVPFAQTIRAVDRTSLIWDDPADVRFVKGDLGAVATYTTTADGTLSAATALDISADAPAPGDGLYYLVKPENCGSWQTAPGAEPARDAALP